MHAKDREASPIEKVAAATVNIVVWARLAEAIGIPAWSGRIFAALSMAAAADPTLPEQWRRVGRIGAAPGAVLVGVLRDHGMPVLDPHTRRSDVAPAPDAKPDVVDV